MVAYPYCPPVNPAWIAELERALKEAKMAWMQGLRMPRVGDTVRCYGSVRHANETYVTIQIIGANGDVRFTAHPDECEVIRRGDPPKPLAVGDKVKHLYDANKGERIISIGGLWATLQVADEQPIVSLLANLERVE